MLWEEVKSFACFLFSLSGSWMGWNPASTVSETSFVPTLHHETHGLSTSPEPVIRRYNFTVKRGIVNLDGFDRPSLLINDQFPGPVIEANYGDTISVTVNNEIEDPEEGTAMHWHGILQKGSPWADGVPGVTQCPIAPGKSLEYTFKAEPYGTSWYHAHYSAQYANGLFGAMIIHGQNHVEYDIDMGPILLTDFFHRYYRDVVLEVLRPRPFPAAPPSDLNLINAKGDWRCTDSLGDTACPDTDNLTKLRLEPGKRHLLRLINAGAEGMQRFSVDNFTLEVIANDFTPLQPYITDVVTVAVGQRVDVILSIPENQVEPVWMRSYISNLCSFTNHHTAHAVAYFTNDTEDVMPSTTGHSIDDSECGGEPIEKSIPFYPIPATSEPDHMEVVEIGNIMNATGQWVWLMNGYVAEADLTNPVLFLVQKGIQTFREQWNIFNTKKARTIRVLLKNPIDFPHPMHIHGHSVKILAEGEGEWDGTITNPSNPNRRDTQMIRSLGYMVFEIDDDDNAGLWPFHCHIGPHLSAGLSVTFMRDPDEVAQLTIPDDVAQTCVDWIAAKDRMPDQIDSGLQVDKA